MISDPMLRTRLHAFTLLELTIALLLVSLLSGFAYYAFGTFSRHTQSRQQQKQEQYGLDLLVHRLKVDCAQSDSIGYQDLQLYFTDSTGQIRYEFTDDYILRSQYELRTDSFYIAAEAPIVQYEQQKGTLTGLVKHIDLILYFRDNTIPLNLEKTYSSQQLIQALSPSVL